MSNLLGGQAAAVGWVVHYVAQPVGQVFLRMLFMIVVPLIFTSLVLGVNGIGDVRKLGRIGGKTFAVFLGTTALAVGLGLFLVNVIQPGNGISPEARVQLMETFAEAASQKVEALAQTGFGIQTFVQIVPRNPVDAAARGDMLALIFFSVVFGLALALVPRGQGDPVLRVVEGIGKAVEVMIGFAMQLAPLGVAALLFSVTAQFGFAVLRSLGMYVVVVLLGLLVHQFGTLSLVARFSAGLTWRDFHGRIRSLMATAFSTSSSNATLPTTLKTAEDFGVPREIAGFVLPLGATVNMNGTALFEGVTVLFLAQAFGLELGFATQLVVVVLVILTAIGASGVPSGSIPLLAGILETVGVPGEGIALILGVDRILDMCRTVPNVTGDLLTSILVSRSEGFLAGRGIIQNRVP
jgi:DAACS family dicarboxylate/amino acid:cation (Na+ or H+) symporter